jgi:hypothetical protein
MPKQIYPEIKTPEELGIAVLGNPLLSIVPPKREHRIDRREYGERLAKSEGGEFTEGGYVVEREGFN